MRLDCVRIRDETAAIGSPKRYSNAPKKIPFWFSATTFFFFLCANSLRFTKMSNSDSFSRLSPCKENLGSLLRYVWICHPSGWGRAGNRVTQRKIKHGHAGAPCSGCCGVSDPVSRPKPQTGQKLPTRISTSGTSGRNLVAINITDFFSKHKTFRKARILNIEPFTCVTLRHLISFTHVPGKV